MCKLARRVALFGQAAGPRKGAERMSGKRKPTLGGLTQWGRIKVIFENESGRHYLMINHLGEVAIKPAKEVESGSG
jgi:hypothetical protein